MTDMGGRGSGRRYHWDARRTVESALRLDVRQLARAADLSKPGTFLGWGWSRSGDTGSSIGISVGEHVLTLSYTYRRGEGEAENVRQAVPLTWTPCNYGGRRPWLRCPGVVNGRYCGRRVAILYLAGRYFLCRRCYGLTYASSQESREDRAARRARKIRKRLGDTTGNLFEPAPYFKPKGMHWQTFSRLRWEAEEARAQMWAGIAGRLGLTVGRTGAEQW